MKMNQIFKGHSPASDAEEKYTRRAHHMFKKHTRAERDAIKRMHHSQHEEVEVNEVSSELLGRYVKKASRDMHTQSWKSARATLEGGQDKTAQRKLQNRVTGTRRAIKRLTKEEIDQIDELSKNTLQSYVNKHPSYGKDRAENKNIKLAHNKIARKEDEEDNERSDAASRGDYKKISYRKAR